MKYKIGNQVAVFISKPEFVWDNATLLIRLPHNMSAHPERSRRALATVRPSTPGLLRNPCAQDEREEF